MANLGQVHGNFLNLLLQFLLERCWFLCWLFFYRQGGDAFLLSQRVRQLTCVLANVCHLTGVYDEDMFFSFDIDLHCVAFRSRGDRLPTLVPNDGRDWETLNCEPKFCIFTCKIRRIKRIHQSCSVSDLLHYWF